MKEWLMTSTLPYWLMFVLVILSSGTCLAVSANSYKSSFLKSFPVFILVTLLTLAVVAGEWYIYLNLKNECLWRCISEDYGFFTKLFRSLPLFIFLFAQISQLWAYRSYVESYIDDEGLKFKGIIICALVLIPVMFVVYILLNMFGVAKETRDMIFYICLGVGFLIGISQTLYKNISVAGFFIGVIFTVVAGIIASGAVISLMLLFNVVIELFFQMLVFIGACIVIGGGLSFVNKGGGGSIAKSAPQQPIWRDEAGHLHSNAGDRDAANAKLKEKK